MTDERMMDKIRKLLALAQDPGAAPNEAETASRQAAALMAKHDLDMSDLTEAEMRKEWDMAEAQMPGCRPGKKNARVVPPWIGVMAFGVKVYTRTRCSSSGGYVKYRGPRADIELAQWMLKALIDLAYTQSRTSSDPTGFRNGFASAVQSRLKKMEADRAKAEDETADQSYGKNLVVLDQRAALMDSLWGPEGRGRRSHTRSNAEGYQAGMKASLPTARPIQASEGRKMLGLA